MSTTTENAAAEVFGAGLPSAQGFGSAAQLGAPRISDQVYAMIREAVLNGQLAPGDRVVESDVARRLGVSQAPVREAVRQLAQEGLLTHLPRKGSFVTEVQKGDVASALLVREPIERLSGGLAAVAMRPEDVARLTEHVDSMRAAARDDNPSRFHEADIAFHREVVLLTGNAVLQRVWEALEPSLRALRAISDPLFAGDWNRLADEHATLLSVLSAGDPDAAAEIFADHAAGRRRSSPPPA